MSERYSATLVSVESTRAFVPSASRPELCAAAFARRGLFASLRRQALTSGSSVSFCSVYARLPSVPLGRVEPSRPQHLLRRVRCSPRCSPPVAESGVATIRQGVLDGCGGSNRLLSLWRPRRFRRTRSDRRPPSQLRRRHVRSPAVVIRPRLPIVAPGLRERLLPRPVRRAVRRMSLRVGHARRPRLPHRGGGVRRLRRRVVRYLLLPICRTVGVKRFATRVRTCPGRGRRCWVRESSWSQTSRIRWKILEGRRCWSFRSPFAGGLTSAQPVGIILDGPDGAVTRAGRAVSVRVARSRSR